LLNLLEAKPHLWQKNAMTKSDSQNLRPKACIVLAAGLGTRMKSGLPKVLHPVAGRPLVRHAVAACEGLNPEKIVVVASPDTQDRIAPVVAPYDCVVQKKPLGTADAVKAAREALEGFKGDILIVCGDVPLATAEALKVLIDKRAEKQAAIVVGGFYTNEPSAYGRLVTDDRGELEAIVEAKDATPDQLDIQFCNSGIYVVDAERFWPLVDKVGNANAKGEYYLTDVVGLAREAGLSCVTASMDSDCALGVNTRVELAEVEARMQDRLRRVAMLSGVTMIDPGSVFLSFDTKLGCDVVIEPNVYFGTGVTIGDNVTIRANCHLEKATVESGAILGPFARLRPDALIGEGAHIGNFVEIKKATISKAAKVNHLTYIGDAFVGERTNIGCGTITCNYDGFKKSHTHIGSDAFIGSDTCLVAPVKVGDGAFIGAGSVITKEVGIDALAVTRAKQAEIPGWGQRFRKSNGKV
jgi:bifunctional UDP-N-acetylglucosamine pyrophosphorylase/glucosamine-1-phosphate N-acetyltransferase